jgi:CrcB protein
LRWALALAWNPLLPALPLGTLAANVIGGFLIGVSAEVLGRMVELPAEWRLFLVTGFLGGFTTFSTFSAETVGLLERGMHGAALVLVLAHVVGSVVATVAGMACVRALAG